MCNCWRTQRGSNSKIKAKPTSPRSEELLPDFQSLFTYFFPVFLLYSGALRLGSLAYKLPPLFFFPFKYLEAQLKCLSFSKSSLISFLLLICSFSFLFAMPHSLWDLVPKPRIKPVSPAVEAQSANHWTAREFP